MKKNMFLLLSLLLLFPSTSFAPKPSRNIIKTIRHLTSGRIRTNPEKQQRALMALLRDQTQVPPSLLFSSVGLLLQESTFPVLTEQSHIIDFAMARFQGVPGFNQLLRRIVVNHDKIEVKGALYELEKAVEIARTANVERIIAFNERKASSTATREFDLITSHRWIECKNVSWKGKKTKQMGQFLDQQGILAEHNKSRVTQLRYVVCSKTTISDSWKTWFAQHDISFSEDTSTE